MGWGPRGAGEPFVTVICPAAKITNTFLSEGLAATGLRALMPPSCGHTWGGGVEGGLGEGMEKGCRGQQARPEGGVPAALNMPPEAAQEAELTPSPPLISVAYPA